jgi:hypothetical protein
LDGTYAGQQTVATLSGPPPIPRPPKASAIQIANGYVPLFLHHPEEIARQLTLSEFELFARVMVTFHPSVFMTIAVRIPESIVDESRCGRTGAKHYRHHTAIQQRCELGSEMYSRAETRSLAG